MELMAKTAYHMFCCACLMPLEDDGWGEVFSHQNLPKKKKEWKTKCEVAICEQNALHEKLLKL